MDKGDRLAGADFIRAAACLMVLAHHLVLRLDVGRVASGWKPAFDLARFGSYGVTLFFVLSGFLLARPFWAALDGGNPMPSLTIYAMRRAARILPGFWLALTVGFILSVTVYGLPLTGELIWRYIAGFLLMSQWHWRTFFPVQGDGPLWSIPFEATCYVLLPLCFALLFRLRNRLRSVIATRTAWLGMIGAVLFCHCLIVAYIPMDEVGRGWDFGFQGGAKEWMPRYNPIGFFAIFAIGAFAAGIHAMLPRRPSLIHDVLGLAVLLTAAAQLPASIGGPWEGYGLFGIPYRFPVLPIAIAAALCTLPRSVLLGPLLDRRAIRFVATISFGIYIWQDIVISLMKKLLPWTFGGGSSNPLAGWLLSSIAATALIFLIATASYVLLERPVLRRARDLESGRRALPTNS